MNHVKSQIGMVGETVSSILNKYYGTPKIMGPKAFIDKAAEGMGFCLWFCCGVCRLDVVTFGWM